MIKRGERIYRSLSGERMYCSPGGEGYFWFFGILVAVGYFFRYTVFSHIWMIMEIHFGKGWKTNEDMQILRKRAGGAFQNKEKFLLPVALWGIFVAAAVAGGAFWGLTHSREDKPASSSEQSLAEEDAIYDLSGAELLENYQPPEKTGTVDLGARNHQPASRDTSALWDKGLFYYLEDVGEGDDNHIAECLLTRMELVREDNGVPVEAEYAIYSLALEDGQAEDVKDVDEWRILLSWDGSGEEPLDLDSALFTPDKAAKGDRNCIYTLNRDDHAGARFLYDGKGKNACGMITLSAPKRGSYKYYVSDYTDIQGGNASSDNLAKSGANVTVFHNGMPVKTFPVPDEAGTVWEVFELREQGIVPIQEVSGDTIGFNLEAGEMAMSIRNSLWDHEFVRYRLNGELIQKTDYSFGGADRDAQPAAYEAAYNTYIAPYPTLNFVENTPENRQKHLFGNMETGWTSQ